MTARKTRRGEAKVWITSFLAAPPSTDSCIAWPFATNNHGYGMVYWQGSMHPVPRLVLTQLVGPPPVAGRVEAAHAPLICHNRACVNPRHLRWATSAENHDDQLADGTHRRGRHPLAKLTSAQALEIYHAEGQHVGIGARYGVSRQTVSNIKNGRLWAWLTGHTATPQLTERNP